MVEYILEAKLKTLKRQLETFTHPLCQYLDLVRHDITGIPKSSALMGINMIHTRTSETLLTYHLACSFNIQNRKMS